MGYVFPMTCILVPISVVYLTTTKLILHFTMNNLAVTLLANTSFDKMNNARLVYESHLLPKQRLELMPARAHLFPCPLRNLPVGERELRSR